VRRRKQLPLLVRQAHAYYRLAAKADRAGEFVRGTQLRGVADRKMAQHHRTKLA
jgi:hypothetical protein